MKRRSFVKASMVTASFAAGIAPIVAKAYKNKDMEKKSGNEFYELKVYTLKNSSQQKLVENYFQHAAIPALNKLGSKNVGVFTEQQPEGQSKIYVIIPYNSAEDFIDVSDKLSNDVTYQQAGAAYLNACC